VLRTKPARTIKLVKKAGKTSSTTAIEIPELVTRKRKEERKRTPTPSSRSKAVTIPRPRKAKASARLPLFLVCEPDDMVAGHVLLAGVFENPAPDRIRAYEPNDLAYAMLTPRNARYLEIDRIWPVLIDEHSGLKRDDTRGNWKFKVVELEPPLRLGVPSTWQHLLEGGLARKPRKKREPSLLRWAAIKGYVDVLNTLLDAGVVAVAGDDTVMAAAIAGQRDAVKLLLAHGVDGKPAAAALAKAKHEAGLAILRELGVA